MSTAVKRQHLTGKVGKLNKDSLRRLLLPDKLVSQSISHSVQALINSVAEQNFLDQNHLAKLNIPLEELTKLLQVSLLDWTCLLEIISLYKSSAHSEQIQVYFCSASVRIPLAERTHPSQLKTNIHRLCYHQHLNCCSNSQSFQNLIYMMQITWCESEKETYRPRNGPPLFVPSCVHSQ